MDYRDLERLVGLEVSSSSAVKILNAIPEEAEILNDSFTTFYLYKNSRIDLRLKSSRVVDWVRVSSDLKGKFTGKLPEHIQFGDSYETVIEKMGSPTKIIPTGYELAERDKEGDERFTTLWYGSRSLCIDCVKGLTNVAFTDWNSGADLNQLES